MKRLLRCRMRSEAAAQDDLERDGSMRKSVRVDPSIRLSPASIWGRMALMLAISCLPWAVQAGQGTAPYPQSAPPRVAYIQKVTPGFELRILDLTTGKTQDLMHFINPPEHLSAARRGQVLLVFEDHALRVLNLQTQKQEEVSPLPEPVVPKGYSEPEPAASGYLADGSLAVVMESAHVSSETLYLYQRTADGWKQIDTGGCGGFDRCPANYVFTHALDGRLINELDPQLILGKAVEQDPYFVSRSVRPSIPDDDGNDETDEGVIEHAITFDFGTSRSTLAYETQPDPDSGPDYISDLSLEVPGQPPQELCEGQCTGEVIGRYFLDGSVIDLSSGKVLLDSGTEALNSIVEMGWVY